MLNYFQKKFKNNKLLVIIKINFTIYKRFNLKITILLLTKFILLFQIKNKLIKT